MYCAERISPEVALVDLVITTLIVAFGATAPLHSTSRSASLSSEELMIPGSVPLMMNWGSLDGRLKRLRKYCTSLRFRLVRAITAIDCPLPLIPALYRGFTL